MFVQRKVVGYLLLCAALCTGLWCSSCGGEGRHANVVPELQPPAQAEQVTLADTLRQLDALPVPDGADPALFASLKAALRQQLVSQERSKFTRQAPGSIRSKVDDLALLPGGGNTIACRWTYRNEGDFDQGGQVGLTDLTPLGIHFGKDSTAADWARASVADGNRNGKVELGDLVSIGANYTYRVTGYHIQYSVDGAEPGAWATLTDVPLASSDLDTNGWRKFNIAAASQGAGYYRIVPYDSAGDGVPGLAVQYDSGPVTHYETEGNDDPASADALPALPFPQPVVNGNLGAGNAAGDDDGDALDWFTTTVTEPGVLSFTMTFDNSQTDLDLYLYQDPLAAPIDYDGGLSGTESVSAQVEAGTYYVRCSSASGCAEYVLTGQFTPHVPGTHYETEHNDHFDEADALPAFPFASQTVTGNMGAGNPEGDDDGDNMDWYTFEASAVGTATFDLYLDEVTGDIDLYLFQDPEGEPLAASEGYSGHEQVAFYLPAAGTYFVRCLLYGGYSEYYLDGAFDADTANHAPAARLSADPYSGSPPLNVNFDASASSDPDAGDSIIKYEFDFGEGNGWEDFGTDPTVVHAYNMLGSYTAQVRVTDGGGLTGTATRHIYTDGSGDQTWNFLVWIAGDNNLAPEGFGDIQEMEAIGSTGQVNVLVGYDIDPSYVSGSGCDKVRFIKVVQDANPNSINVSGDPANVSFNRAGYNSADPQRLLEFLQWAAQFPAEHSVLVLWDHGSGWREGWKGGSTARGKAGKPRPGLGGLGHTSSGVLCDDVDGVWDLTNNKFIVDTLAGYHFDMVAYDACNMGHFEAAYDFRNLADWQVTSQVLVPGPGFPYDAILQGWNAGFPLAADELGKIMCDEFALEYAADWVTLGVVDSTQVDGLATTLGTLAATVTANAAAESENVKDAIYDAYEPGSSDGERDLWGFLELYRSKTANAAIQGELDAAMAQWQNTLVYFKQVSEPETTGLGLYLPSDYYFDQATQDEYGRTEFDQATGWLAMLQATGVPTSGSLPEVETNWVVGDKLELTWSDNKADINLLLRNPYYSYGAPYFPDLLAGEVLFSADNPAGGGTAEWGQLLAGAPSGEWLQSISWDGYSGGTLPPTISVTVQLYDSGGTLKQDLGTYDIGYYEMKEYALLHLLP